MEDYKIIVVGGGFSGLIVAERLSEKYRGQVAVIERNDRVGKKILSTGNGRGNFTNEALSEKNYHSVEGFNSLPAIKKYGNKSIKDYFASLGVDFSVEDGKVYPSSFQASALLDALRAKLAFNGATVKTGEKCVSITYNGKFTVKTEKGEYSCDKVVLACGGKAQKQFGTDGTAYALVESFGHKTTALYPSLVQLKTETEHIRGLKGIKQVAKIKAIRRGKVLAESFGDILFTEYGVSGNAVFSISPFIAGKSDCSLSIEFLTDKTEREVEEFLVKKSALKYISAENALSGVVNKQLGISIVKRAKVKEFNEETAKILAKEIKNFNLKVTGTLGFDYCQVTRGGIEYKGVDENTFESKLIKGLYIIGEMLDIDGDCGGYNLQFAYSSAICASSDLL